MLTSNEWHVVKPETAKRNDFNDQNEMTVMIKKK